MKNDQKKEKGGVDPEAPPIPCRGNDRASETNPDIYASERVRKVCASCKKVSMIDVSRCIYCHECTRRLQDWRL